MKLVSATVGPFRSINEAQVVEIDPEVTVLVGMNEAGKTVFLRALHKALDAMEVEKFDPVEDYPRKDYSAYSKRHSTDPDTAVKLTYQPSEELIQAINAELHTDLKPGLLVTVSHTYANGQTISINNVSETPVIEALANTPGLSTDTVATIKKASSLKGIVDLLSTSELTEVDTTFLADLKKRVAKTTWNSVVLYEVWSLIKKNIPKFLYFSDYDLLPGKLNLADLSARLANAAANPANARMQIQPKHQAVLALLRMADVDLADLSSNSGYEAMKAKIEAVSINLTDQVLEFWKQNEDLEVEVDIKSDSTDEAPFNNGPNLYLRIKNRRHRGVSTPFEHILRCCIWSYRSSNQKLHHIFDTKNHKKIATT